MVAAQPKERVPSIVGQGRWIGDAVCKEIRAHKISSMVESDQGVDPPWRRQDRGLSIKVEGQKAQRTLH